MTNKNYEKKIHKLLKTYNSVLVKCTNIPILSDKNVVMVENMDSMINAQLETRKPILYFQEEQCVSFMLLDGTETYIHIVKAYKHIISEVEQTINKIEVVKNTFAKEILSELEKILLNGVESKNLLTANELTFLGGVKDSSEQKENIEDNNSIKESKETSLESKNEKDNNISIESKVESENVVNIENKVEKINIESKENNTDKIEEDIQKNTSSKSLALVPFKKKKRFHFFSKMKTKGKRINSDNAKRRSRIGYEY